MSQSFTSTTSLAAAALTGTVLASNVVTSSLTTLGTLTAFKTGAITGYINDDANANMTVGLTINQGANDNQIFACKSSDVGHGATSIAGTNTETDDYLAISKINADEGGVSLNALAEDAAVTRVLDLWAVGGTADTTKTTAGVGLVSLFVTEHNGANTRANITADGNVFAIIARVGASFVTRFLVDEDGDMYSVTAGQTFDDYDDKALVKAYDVIRRDDLRAQYGEFVDKWEADLIALGVLGAPIAEGGLTNVTQLQRLHNGRLIQQGEEIDAVIKENGKLGQRIAQLERLLLVA